MRDTFIFRSDSNGEDLEGFSGAGLFDSIPMDAPEERPVDYACDPIVCDRDGFQKRTLAKIAEAGAAIERAMGSPQDIEGVVVNGEVFVVQTRPQV